MISQNFIKRTLSSIILIPLIFFIIFSDTILFNLFISICFVIAFYEWNKMTRKLFSKLTGFVFLLFSFYTTFQLKNYLDFENFYLLFVISICIATDLGGYSFGKILKGPKLTSISPKKTYSGLLGAIILSILVSLFFYKYDYKFGISIQLNSHFIILIVLISIISQIGDITISLFKRLAKISDTGNIIPGHGGLLDRIDGMLFAIPFLFLILKMNIFNFL
jgi:phosphatidate cytidylyltransferase